MKRFQYVITNPEGLHARLAVYLANICRDAESHVEVSHGRKTASGKEVFAVMNLYAGKDNELRFKVEGSDEDEILRQIVEFCKRYL